MADDVRCWARRPFRNPHAGGGGGILCGLNPGHDGPHDHHGEHWTDQEAAAISAMIDKYWADFYGGSDR